MEQIVVGISGASGIILAHKTVFHLTRLGYFVHLVITKDAYLTAVVEMGKEYGTPSRFMASFAPEQRKQIALYNNHDFSAPIASGSFQVFGTIIIPCSMATISALAVGLSDNLLRRVGDVCLKERRPLVIVPRETPLHAVHLENMLKITQMGGVIVPPVPAWYLHPKSLSDVEDFVICRALDALKIPNSIHRRWEGLKP